MTEPPKPTPVARGSSTSAGSERDRRVHADPEQERREVRRPHAAERHHPHVDEGIVTSQLVADPRGDEQRAGAEQPERLPRAEAPAAGLADGDEQCRQAGDHERRRREVDGSRGADRRAGHPPHDGPCDRNEHREREPEQPTPAQRGDDRAGDHESEPGADTEQGGDEADRPGHALALELVAQNAERQREHRSPGALSDATGEHHRQRGRERARERAQAERAHDDAEHAVLAVDVAHPAEHRREHGGRQKVHGEDPGAARGTRAQRAVDVGQGGHDGCLQDREHRACQRQHGHDQITTTVFHHNLHG